MNKEFVYIKPSLTIKSFPSKEIYQKINTFNELFFKEYNLCSLEEGLKETNNKKIIIDIKFNNDYYELSNKLDDVLKNYDRNRIIIQSLDLEGLSLMRMKYPDYNYLALVDKEEDLEKARFFDNVGIKKNLLDYDYVKDFINEDGIVAVWTIDSTKEVEKTVDELDDLYKDVIYITDYPDITNYELNKIKKKTNN